MRRTSGAIQIHGGINASNGRESSSEPLRRCSLEPRIDPTTKDFSLWIAAKRGDVLAHPISTDENVIVGPDDVLPASLTNDEVGGVRFARSRLLERAEWQAIHEICQDTRCIVR